MKQLFLFTIITTVLLSGCNKLKDTTLTDNPYDKDYTGPKVVSINDISTSVLSVTVHEVRITVTSSTQFYEAVVLYKNGTNIGSFLRTNFNSGSTFTETISIPSVIGATYSYEAKLTYNSGSTSLSDAVSYTTL